MAKHILTLTPQHYLRQYVFNLALSYNLDVKLAHIIQAILGAHGYKSHEVYDPAWRHVHVPEQFLNLVCPMAEGVHAEIVGECFYSPMQM